MTDPAPVCSHCGARLIFRGQTSCQSCGQAVRPAPAEAPTPTEAPGSSDGPSSAEPAASAPAVTNEVAHCRVCDVDDQGTTYRSGIEFIDMSEPVAAVIAEFVDAIKNARQGT